MFRFIGIISVIVGIFWLGDSIGFDGVRAFFINLGR